MTEARLMDHCFDDEADYAEAADAHDDICLAYQDAAANGFWGRLEESADKAIEAAAKAKASYEQANALYQKIAAKDWKGAAKDGKAVVDNAKAVVDSAKAAWEAAKGVADEAKAYAQGLKDDLIKIATKSYKQGKAAGKRAETAFKTIRSASHGRP
jgi:hypothetical protein